jgi:hypothetical protein
VCASPEAIKSLMLKFVEQLHALEIFDFSALKPGDSMRFNKEITRMREMMTARSSMADALVPVLQVRTHSHTPTHTHTRPPAQTHGSPQKNKKNTCRCGARAC